MKGVGEVAMLGVAPAITNAVIRVNGSRMGERPVTPNVHLGGLYWASV